MANPFSRDHITAYKPSGRKNSPQQFVSHARITRDGMWPTLLIGNHSRFIETQKVIRRGLHIPRGNWRIDNISTD